MKQIINRARAAAGVFGLSMAVLVFTGCQTEQSVYPEGQGAGSSTNTGQLQAIGDLGNAREAFQKGDTVTLSFSGGPETMPDHSETIKDDGTVTLPYIGTMVGPQKAAGKTPAALQKELQEIYNRYYKNLTVTVQPLQRFFHVLGEVMKPGPYPILGPTDITKAITAAGGFTDFADRKRVQLTRFGAQKPVRINCIKALRDPKYDVPVYPGDEINVPRRTNPFGL